MPFTHEIQVKENDIDQMGHVNNVVFVRYIQEVAEAHWKNFASANLQNEVVWVVLRHEIDYKKPAFANETIIGETWITEPSGPKMPRFVTLKNKEGDVFVKSKTTWCALDGKTHSPVRISKELYKLFKG